MIQEQTRLMVADNSGARTVQCIKVLGGSRKRVAHIGDRIVVVVKALRSGGLQPKSKVKAKAKVKKAGIYEAVVVRSYPVFRQHAVVLISRKGDPLGTRVQGPLSMDLVRAGWTRITALAPRLI